MESKIILPVSYIEGIGDATEKLFNRNNIFTIVDFLRTPVTISYRAVKSIASMKEVISWYGMAQFLQVSTLTNQDAEVLYRSGIKTFESLTQKTPTEIKSIFEAAVNKSITRTVPSDDEIYKMLHEATVINYTGKIDGRVLDKSKIGISGVTISIGNLKTLTDTNGYFRLWKIPMRRRLKLVVEKDGIVLKEIENPMVAYDTSTSKMTRIILDQQVQSEPQVQIALHEIDGDILPSAGAHKMETRRINYSQVREGDIFKVIKLYEKTPHAHLLSRFRSFVNGKFIIYSVKVPLSDFSDSAKPGEHFIFQKGKFKQIRMSPRKREVLMRYNKFRLLNPGQPSAGKEQIKQMILEMFNYAYTRNNG